MKLKQFLAQLLCVCLIVSLMPQRALAEGNTANEVPAVEIKGCSLTLQGDIGLNFYVSIPSEYRSDMSYSFTYKGTTGDEISVQNVPHSGDLYKFTYHVSAKDMEEEVRLHLFCDGEEAIAVKGSTVMQGGYAYSVAEYIKLALSRNVSANLGSLMWNMRAYGEYAETYFGVNRVRQDYSGVLLSVKDVDFTRYEYSEEGSVEGVQYYGSSLILKTNTTIKHYFQIADGMDLPSVMVNGQAAEWGRAGALAYIEIDNIAAQDLGNEYTVRIQKDDQEYVLGYSAMSYVQTVLAMNRYDDLNTLVKALYGYYVASLAYFGNEHADTEGVLCQHSAVQWTTDETMHECGCLACGEVLVSGQHVLSASLHADDAAHYHECVICGLREDEEAHYSIEDEIEIVVNGKSYLVCAACGGLYERRVNGGNGGGTTPPGNVTVGNFKCLAADVFTTYFSAQTSMEEFYAWQQFRRIEEARGVNLQVEWVNYDQYNTTLQTRFGAMNDIPDYVSGYDYPETFVLALANNGMILDINTILPYSDGTAVHFFENNDNGIIARNKVSTPEGNMYWVPNIYISEFDGQLGVGTNAGVNIRYDWLQAQGLSMPTTTAEFKSTLQTFNQAYGHSVAGDAVYSYRATQLIDGIAQWFGLVRGLLNVDWHAGRAQSPWLQEGFTEYITYINDLYRNGLYDPEMIHSNDTLRTKVSQNLVGAYTAYALSTTYEPLISAANVNGTIGACYVGVYPINAIDGIQALLGLEDPVYVWDEFFITNQCTNLQLAAAFLDGYYSDEHLDLVNYGVEGKNYTIVNGEKQWMTYTDSNGVAYNADQLNQSLQDKADERISYGKILYIRGGFPDYTYYHLGDASHNCTNVLGWAAPKDQYQQATLNYGYWTSLDVGGTLATASRQETEVYNRKYNDVSTASQAAIGKLVVDGNILDIPGYTATLNALGLSELVAIYQARYDRFVG